MSKWIFVGLFVALASGCVAPQDRYHWGAYEEMVYLMYAHPGEATPEVQIERLTRDRQKAQAQGKPIPPGVNAHIGMMYAAMGNVGQALAAFEEEKSAYPESKQFMDDMINRAKGVVVP